MLCASCLLCIYRCATSSKTANRSMYAMPCLCIMLGFLFLVEFSW
jgi:hypothetical protein